MGRKYLDDSGPDGAGVRSGTTLTVESGGILGIEAGGSVQLGAVASSGLFMGGGSASSPLTSAVAAACFVKMYCKSTDTGEDNRLGYFYYVGAGAGGGFEAIRAKAVGSAAAIGAIRGGSFAAELDTTATSQVGGAGYGVEASFNALAATRVMTGTIAAMHCQSFIAAGNTVPASHAFIRCSNAGAVNFTNLFDLSSVTHGTNSSSVLISTNSTDDPVTYKIKILTDVGQMWIMCTTEDPD